MRKTSLVALVVAGALTVLAAGGASADETRFTDATGDTSARSDIRWVEVTNSRLDNRFTVAVGLSKVVYGAELIVFVDRNRANPGPELRMVALADSEWALFRVGRWGERGIRIDTCGRVSYSKSTHRPIAVWQATRTCLDLNHGVRVAVKVDDPGYGTDWAPARRAFFPAVSAAR